MLFLPYFNCLIRKVVLAFCGNMERKICMIFARLSVVCFMVVLSACSMKPVKMIDSKDPISFTERDKSRPIEFSGMKYKLPRGKQFGESARLGILSCDYRTKLYWESSNNFYFNNDALEEAFKSELENANYVVTNDPDSFRREMNAIDPELLVTALVKDLSLQVCRPHANFWTGLVDEGMIEGGAYIKIKWRVFDGLQRRTIYETVTEGSASIKEARPGSETGMITDAFAMATNNLLSDEGFYKVASQSFDDIQEKNQHERMTLRGVAITTAKADMDKIKESVVTVSMGDGHGSGFVIADGYILTNNHVVGGGKRAKVTAATGLELVGHVLRRDPYRDVALVKIEKGYLTPLPLQIERPIVGEAVYAIGSPQREELASTVTKGIISKSNRIWKDKTYIQADVSIYGGNSGGALVDENGNVVGISVAGFLDRRSLGSTNLNLFIPIKEGVEALNLEVTKR